MPGLLGKLFGPKETPETTFWQWFSRSSDRLFRLEAAQERLLDELARHLHRVDPQLSFQIGSVENGRRELVISADGIRDMIPVVQSVVEAAPVLPQWQVVAFRQRMDEIGEVQFNDAKLGPEDAWVAAVRHHDVVDLQVYMAGYDGNESGPMIGAAFILLDSALGEYDMMTRVGVIEWRALPPDPASMGLIPLPGLASAFDRMIGRS